MSKENEKSTAGRDPGIRELIKSGDAFSVIGERIEKAYEGEDGNFYIEAIGSSDQEDLVGDIMSLKALQTMEKEFVGKTVFMNHRTMVPDDVFGSVVETKLLKKDGMQLLWFKIVVEKENEPAMKTYRMIEGKRIQLGTSVTILVKSKAPNPKRNKGIIIEDCESIEFSIVGVACNRESKTLTASASKALGIALANKSGEEIPENSEILQKGDESMSLETDKKTTGSTAQTETATPEQTVTVKDFFPLTKAAIELARVVKSELAEGKSVKLDQVVAKGLFNDILNQEPRLYELWDILCSVRWKLESNIWIIQQAGGTDFSAILTIWSEALDEFKAAAIKSFSFWNKISTPDGEISEDDDEMLSNALVLEKSFTTLTDALGQIPEGETKKSLLEIGTRLLQAAKKAGIEFPVSEAGTSATQNAEPVTEPVEKSAEFITMKDRAELAERNLKQTQADLSKANEELEIAKAGLAVAVEAQEVYLRQPLVSNVS